MKWKEIKGHKGFFVSDTGRVEDRRGKGFGKEWWREKRKVIPFLSCGYPHVSLGGRKKQAAVHRLVAEAFITNPWMKPFVNHKDANKANSNVRNLEWVTPQENSIHAGGMGLIKKKPETIEIMKRLKEKRDLWFQSKKWFTHKGKPLVNRFIEIPIGAL